MVGACKERLKDDRNGVAVFQYSRLFGAWTNFLGIPERDMPHGVTFWKEIEDLDFEKVGQTKC